MKKKILIGLSSIIALSLIGLFGLGPRLVDTSMNAPEPHDPYVISPEALALHKRLRVADLHADSMLWKRDFLERHDYGLMDLPRAQDGSFAVQVFGVVTKVPPASPQGGSADMRDTVTPLVVINGWPPRTWTSLLERTLYQAERLDDFSSRSNGQMVFVTTRGELSAVLDRRLVGEAAMAALMGIEGAQALEGDLANLDKLEDAGIRMIGLAHFYDNFAAGSAHGAEKYGLTEAGVKLLDAAESKRMIIDVAHLSPAGLDDVLDRATRPVVVSHTGVQGTCAGERNLSDKHIKRIAAAGGIIGIGIWETAVCSTDLSGTIRAISYVRDLVGIDHVSLGMDMDGTIHGFIDGSEMAAVTQALMDAGYSDQDIAKVMGENTIEFLLEWLP